jgi:hypothetical protein
VQNDRRIEKNTKRTKTERGQEEMLENLIISDSEGMISTIAEVLKIDKQSSEMLTFKNDAGSLHETVRIGV